MVECAGKNSPEGDMRRCVMDRNRIVFLIGLVGLCLLVTASPLMAQGEKSIQAKYYYLRGNVEKASGVIATDKEPVEVVFSGTIGFRVTPGLKGGFTMSLDRLNLISKGVPTARGKSGLIGLNLASPGFEVKHDVRSGQLSSAIQSTLHYELIDRVKGFRQSERAKGEMDVFIPYTEKMSGHLKGKLPENMKLAEKGTVRFIGEVQMELSASVIGSLKNITVKIPWVVIEWLKSPAEVLKIQPVFVGTGPSDPNATGKAFQTLKNRAAEAWGKCGTVRCMSLVYNEPIYINNASYRILDSATEARNFSAEVNVADAIEIFVAESMSTSLTCSWGGGATYSSGTASAKIVTSDQQLSVPCPCPTACSGYCPLGPCSCGALNNYHLAHELGHVINLAHPGDSGLAPSTATSVMEPSGFCNDNPSTQSAKNCRNASNPLLYWGKARCLGSPDIMD